MSDERSNECPDLLHFTLLELLRYSILCIRGERDPDITFLHADHIHNLPSLLTDFKPELLAYYWEIERPCFLKGIPADKVPQIFEPIWLTIEREYVRLCQPRNA